MSINHRGEKFSGVNKPKRTPNHPTKSHAVLASENGKKKLIRFGQGQMMDSCTLHEMVVKLG